MSSQLKYLTGTSGSVLLMADLAVCVFQEYIHRVGRTARGEGGRGHALLILGENELGFLRYLKQAKVPLNEFEFSWSKVSNIQPQVGVFVVHVVCLFCRLPVQ